MNFIVREGKREDVPQVLELIKELAEYERAPQEVTNTVEMMLEDGFGKSPIYGMFVADLDGKIIGISVYYFRYSTWKGRRLYLEDIVVTESMRGKRVGKALFEKTMQFSLDSKCSGIVWQVLEWNEPAINFYRKYNANFDPEWINCSMSETQVREFLNLKGN